MRLIPGILIVLVVQLCYAQKITGFWEVLEVKVGNDIKTPVAKWTRINEDGTYQSGNGWIQNSEGTWNFDKANNSFLPTETNGIKDPYGAFKVSYLKDEMIWERAEDEMTVRVKLQRTSRLPKSTGDLLVGLWDLKEILRNGKSEKSSFDPDDKYYIFIRWDRVYVERTSKGEKASGFWHINGHRPEVTFFKNTQGREDDVWNVSVNEQTLKMVGISDSNRGVEFIYIRINDFPK
ncbi:hypothetical protein [Chryseolinea sp. H1M3-3]|uniref:hypothetical protein n=1 Tax=Chryseolinea sp. H1M3-3 TaxID=3034144 RepID=UPI0023ED3083|nr:hypothetical protein [Chryseolinea sp. H1M3-3]